tara:strand:- start:431 stop:616 length:186 start_codon:yes stop_codon:yes gene_type:complete
MKMYMYSVEDKNGQPRSMFATLDEAKASRQPEEYVAEYIFNVEDSEIIVFPSTLNLDGGEE